MFIKLHDSAGMVHLTSANHIVDLTPAPANRTDYKTRVLTVNGTLLIKESMAEIYTLCDEWTSNSEIAILSDNLPRPYGAESLTPAWVTAVDVQIRAEKKDDAKT